MANFRPKVGETYLYTNFNIRAVVEIMSHISHQAYGTQVLIKEHTHEKFVGKITSWSIKTGYWKLIFNSEQIYEKLFELLNCNN